MTSNAGQHRQRMRNELKYQPPQTTSG